MNLNDLFYKPRRLAKKTKLQKLKICALFLAAVTTLGTLGFIVNKYSSNKKTNNSSISIEEMRNDIFNNYLTSISKLNFSKKVTRAISLIDEKILTIEEEPTFEDILRERIESIEVTNKNASFRDNVVETVLKVREVLKDIPNEDKYNYILEHYKMNPTEFDEIQATIGGEAKPDKPQGTRYIDAFTSLNSMYNRIRSYKKCGYARAWLHKSGDITLYEHATAPGQYTAYKGENYYKFLGTTSGEHYQAVLDFLCVADILTETTEFVNPFLDFMASGQGINERFVFVKGGNEFSFKQPSSDRIPIEELYYIYELEEENEDVNTLTLEK